MQSRTKRFANGMNGLKEMSAGLGLTPSEVNPFVETV